jgi:hypothetical protein
MIVLILRQRPGGVRQFSERARHVKIYFERPPRESAFDDILSCKDIAYNGNEAVSTHDLLPRLRAKPSRRNRKPAFHHDAMLSLDYAPMRVISFKNTGLFKRGIWLTAAALLVFVAAPPLLDGSLWRDPAPSVIAVTILGSFLLYFLVKMQIHRLADEVTDCGSHLQVRRGRTELAIPMSNISAAEVLTFSGIHRVCVHLHQPTKLGGRIEFLPQASLWSDLPAVKRLALELAERANSAKGPVK